MNGSLNGTIEIRGGKALEKLLVEYRKWNKAQPAEITNAKLYFISLQSMRETKMADKNIIAEKLKAPSRVEPEIPLAQVLVNKDLGRRKKKKLSGSSYQMIEAVDKFIKKSQSRIQALRSGWLPALKILDYYNKKGDITFSRRFAPKKPSGVKQYGKDKGSAIYARPNTSSCFGKISNNFGKGKQDSSTVTNLLLAGLRKGINLEMRSMLIYINRKYTEYHNKLNRRNTFA